MDFAAFRESLRQPELGDLSDEELRAQLLTLSQGFCALFDAHLELHKRLEETQARLREVEADYRRLKGLPDPPDRGSSGSSGAAASQGRQRRNTSSERERKRKRRTRPCTRLKARKIGVLQTTETMRVEMERASLPADAKRKGYRRVLKQDLLIEVRVVEMLLARYYSRSERKTYQAPAPAGWEGEFGPVLKALVVMLCHGMNQSQAPIHDLLTQLGVKISRGKLCDLAVRVHQEFTAERRAVFRAGLESSPWQQTDMTSTTVNGRLETCQVIGNPAYTHFHTSPDHDRAGVVRLLRAETRDLYLLDEETLELLRARGWSERRLNRLRSHAAPFLRSREVLRRKIRALAWSWNEEQQEEFWSCALVAAYRCDVEIPRVRCLLTDDASLYHGLSPEPALCWIHELRHLKELNPAFACYASELRRVLRQAWKLYRDLERYCRHPDAATVLRLSDRFEEVFGQQVSYSALQATLERTHKKKERLLLVLEHPELPLHNNDMELGARKRVRKRDVSFGPRSRAGVKAWDIFQGLSATTAKLGVRFYEYLLDRITRAGTIPPLEDLVRAKADELGLGRTWTDLSTSH